MTTPTIPAHWIQASTVRLMRCAECGIETNHSQTPSGDWVCWCGNVDADQRTAAQRNLDAWQDEARDVGFGRDGRPM